MVGHKATHTVYQSWYPEFLRESSSAGPGAELIVVGHRATLRIFQGRSRRVTTIHLGGGDALKFHVSGFDFQLLDFSAQRLPGPVPRVAPQGKVFQFYFCSRSRFSTDSVKGLTRRLMVQFGITGVTITVRDDTWFIEEPTFPSYYRFTPGEATPTAAQYRAGRQTTCISDGTSNIRCY